MTAHKISGPDLTRITLQVLWIGILIAASFWIMRPLLPSLIWAAMIVAATWPFMLKMESWLWGKRGLAVAVMTIVMLLLFIVPFTFAITVIIENAERITAWVKTLETKMLPPLPGWVTGIPIAGPKLGAAWEHATAGRRVIGTHRSLCRRPVAVVPVPGWEASG